MESKQKHHQIQPWTEFEPLLSQLRQALNCSNSDALQYMGYSGGTVVSEWKRNGAPTVAINAAKGVLIDLGTKPKGKESVTFSLDELLELQLALYHKVTSDVLLLLRKKVGAAIARSV